MRNMTVHGAAANRRGSANTGRRKASPASAPSKAGRDPIFDELDRRIAEEEEQVRLRHGRAGANNIQEPECEQ